MDLWRQVHHCFDTDDGSLPEMRLTRLSSDDLGALFDLLRTIGQLETSHEHAPTFWDKRQNTDVRVDAVPNAAALVAEDLAEGFTVMLRNARFEGVPIPDLGVQVHPETIFLFFRMGSEWNPPALHAFLRLLQAMKRIAPRSGFEFDSTFVDPIAFLGAWEKFNS